MDSTEMNDTTPDLPGNTPPESFEPLVPHADPTAEPVEAPEPDATEAAVSADGSAAPARVARRPEALVADVEEAIRRDPRPGFHLDRVRRAKNRVVAAGDEVLAKKLADIEDAIIGAQAGEYVRKEQLCADAEQYVASVDWKATAERLKALQAEWKSLGSAGREADAQLWTRFRAAMDAFFTRRAADLEERAAHRRDRQVVKEALCADAEQLAESGDWKATTEKFAALMDAWKLAGSAGRDADQALWKRFSEARAKFFERRGAHHKQVRKEQDQNKQRKEALCVAAEGLAALEDNNAACERAKELQAEWKAIGAAPRDVHQALWERFRGACNVVFERARSVRDQRRTERSERSERRDAPVDQQRRRSEEKLALEESIAREKGHLDRWRMTLKTIRDDGHSNLRAELQVKIAEVENRLAEKQARLVELQREAAEAHD